MTVSSRCGGPPQHPAQLKLDRGSAWGLRTSPGVGHARSVASGIPAPKAACIPDTTTPLPPMETDPTHARNRTPSASERWFDRVMAVRIVTRLPGSCAGGWDTAMTLCGSHDPRRSRSVPPHRGTGPSSRSPRSRVARSSSSTRWRTLGSARSPQSSTVEDLANLDFSRVEQVDRPYRRGWSGTRGHAGDRAVGLLARGLQDGPRDIPGFQAARR